MCGSMTFRKRSQIYTIAYATLISHYVAYGDLSFSKYYGVVVKINILTLS